MKIQASAKNVPVTPRKARLIVDMVRNQPAQEIVHSLKFSDKKAAREISKLIEAAIANANHNYDIPKDNLLISSIQAQEGVVLKRWTPRAHGRATPILKRRSHIFIELEEIKKSKEKKKGKKSKMQIVTYDEVKKALSEAKKATGAQSKVRKEEIKKSERKAKKEIESKPKFSRLGDKFKNALRKRNKQV